MVENEVVSGRLGDPIMSGKVNEAGVRPGPMSGAVTRRVQKVSISWGCV